MGAVPGQAGNRPHIDRKSTRLNSSHLVISYAVFCLKKTEHFIATDPALPQQSYGQSPAAARGIAARWHKHERLVSKPVYFFNDLRAHLPPIFSPEGDPRF